jgi:hypothetical protein
MLLFRNAWFFLRDHRVLRGELLFSRTFPVGTMICFMVRRVAPRCRAAKARPASAKPSTNTQSISAGGAEVRTISRR